MLCWFIVALVRFTVCPWPLEVVREVFKVGFKGKNFPGFSGVVARFSRFCGVFEGHLDACSASWDESLGYWSDKRISLCSYDLRVSNSVDHIFSRILHPFQHSKPQVLNIYTNGFRAVTHGQQSKKLMQL